LLVIDFIDMDSPKHQREIEERMKDALKLDRARVQVGRISRFGLLELSRQRLRPSLEEASQVVCPRCDGHGVIRGVESLSLSTLRLIEEHAMKENTGQVLVQAPSTVANFLLNEKRASVVEIELRHKVHVMIVADEKLQTPHIEIQRIREADMGEHSKPSYERLTVVEPEALPKMGQVLGSGEHPAVSGIMPASPAPLRAEVDAPIASEQTNTRVRRRPAAAPAATTGGVLARVLKWFGGSAKPAEVASEPAARQASHDKSSGRNHHRDEQGGRATSGNGRSGTSSRAPRREPRSQTAAKSASPSPAKPARKRPGESTPRQSQSTQTAPVEADRIARPLAADNNPAGIERKPADSVASKPERQPRPARSERPAAAPKDESASEVAATTASELESSTPMPTDTVLDADGNPARRRRGRRGGRRRRRHDETTATGTENTGGNETVSPTHGAENPAKDDTSSAGRSPEGVAMARPSASPRIVNDALPADNGSAPGNPLLPTAATSSLTPQAAPAAAEGHSSIEAGQPVSRVSAPTPTSAASVVASTAESFHLPTLPPIPAGPGAPAQAANLAAATPVPHRAPTAGPGASATEPGVPDVHVGSPAAPTPSIVVAASATSVVTPAKRPTPVPATPAVLPVATPAPVIGESRQSFAMPGPGVSASVPRPLEPASGQVAKPQPEQGDLLDLARDHKAAVAVPGFDSHPETATARDPVSRQDDLAD
jgi:ribonuclease E